MPSVVSQPHAMKQREEIFGRSIQFVERVFFKIRGDIGNIGRPAVSLVRSKFGDANVVENVSRKGGVFFGHFFKR
jgi:hypothetical protein